MLGIDGCTSPENQSELSEAIQSDAIEAEEYPDSSPFDAEPKDKLVNTKNEIMELVSGPVFSKCSGEEAYKILCVSDKFMDPACIFLYRR